MVFYTLDQIRWLKVCEQVPISFTMYIPEPRQFIDIGGATWLTAKTIYPSTTEEQIDRLKKTADVHAERLKHAIHVGVLRLFDPVTFLPVPNSQPESITAQHLICWEDFLAFARSVGIYVTHPDPLALAMEKEVLASLAFEKAVSDAQASDTKNDTIVPKRQRSDDLAVVIDNAVALLTRRGEKITARSVMALLSERVGKDGYIIDKAPDGVIWINREGERGKLTHDALRKRLRRAR